MFAIEAFEEQELPFQQTAIAENLLQVREQIALEGMCRDHAMTLDAITPGIFGGRNLRSFTALPSNTLRSVALERIDFKRLGIIAAAGAAIIFVIAKIFKWLLNLFGNLGGSGGGGGGSAISDIPKLEQSFEKTIGEFKPVPKSPRSTPENPKPSSTPSTSSNRPSEGALSKFLTNEDSYSNYYIRELIKLTDSKGLRHQDAVRAAERYFKLMSLLDIDKFNKRGNAILGELLLSPNGAFPMTFEYGGKHSFSGSTIKELYGQIDGMSSLLEMVNKTIMAMSRVSKVDTKEDGTPELSGSFGEAYRESVTLYAAMSARVTSAASDRHSFINMTPPGRYNKTNKVVVSVRGNMQIAINRIMENKGKYLSLWAGSNYQNGNKAEDPSVNGSTARPLAEITDFGFDPAMGDTYKAMFDSNGVPVFKDRIERLLKLLEDTETGMEKLRRDKGSIPQLLEKLPHKAGSVTTDISIMDVVMDSLDLAKSTSTVVQQAFVAAGIAIDGRMKIIRIVSDTISRLQGGSLLFRMAGGK